MLAAWYSCGEKRITRCQTVYFDRNGDVLRFFLYFENVKMKGKERNDYYLKILTYLEGSDVEIFSRS